MEFVDINVGKKQQILHVFSNTSNLSIEPFDNYFVPPLSKKSLTITISSSLRLPGNFWINFCRIIGGFKVDTAYVEFLQFYCSL